MYEQTCERECVRAADLRQSGHPCARTRHTTLRPWMQFLWMGTALWDAAVNRHYLRQKNHTMEDGPMRRHTNANIFTHASPARVQIRTDFARTWIAYACALQRIAVITSTSMWTALDELSKELAKISTPREHQTSLATPALQINHTPLECSQPAS